MSSILKALKKLEEDKNRQENGRVDIATDILRTSGRSRRRAWIIPLTLIVLVFGGTLGGMFVARMFMPPVQTQPVQTQPVQTQPVQTQPVQTQPVQTQPVPTQPVPTQPVPTQPVLTQPVPTPPVLTQPVPTQPVLTQPVPTQPVPTQPVPTQPVPTQPVQTQPVQTQPVQTQPVQTQPVQTQPVPKISNSSTADPDVGPVEHPPLVVSGIAYQKDEKNRMAVVNDLPVLSGTSIEGVEVVEILPDQVVFRYEGVEFAIPLAGNR